MNADELKALDERVEDFTWSYDATGNGATTPAVLVKDLHAALRAATAAPVTGSREGLSEVINKALEEASECEKMPGGFGNRYSIDDDEAIARNQARRVFADRILELAHAAAPVAESRPADGQNPLVAFLLSSDTGMSSKAIAARYAGVTPSNGYFSHPYDSGDFGRCHRLLQLVPEINIGVMRGASPRWDKLVEAWPELTAAFERADDWKAFHAIINPLIH